MEKVTNWAVSMRVECEGIMHHQRMNVDNEQVPVFLPNGKGKINISIASVEVADTDANALLDAKREILSLERRIIDLQETRKFDKGMITALQKDVSVLEDQLNAANKALADTETALRILLNAVKGGGNDEPKPSGGIAGSADSSS